MPTDLVHSLSADSVPMSWFRRQSLLLLAFGALGCTTRMVISVNPPEAEIVALPVGGGEATPLGSAEVTLDGDLLAERNLSLPLVIKASAAGRESLAVLVTSLPSAETRVSVRLQPSSADTNGEADEGEAPKEDQAEVAKDEDPAQKESVTLLNDPRLWNSNVRLILEAERYLNQKDPERAREIARRLQEATPWLSIAYVLEGTSYFLEQDLTRARSALERATQLDPQDLSALQFLQQVDQMLGRQPNAASGAEGTP